MSVLGVDVAQLRTNWTVVDDFLESAKHRASIELSLRYGKAPPLEIVVITVTTGVLLTICCIFFCIHTIVVWMRYKRMKRNESIVAMADSPEDDCEEHEEELHEQRRTAAPGDSSDEEALQKNGKR